MNYLLDPPTRDVGTSSTSPGVLEALPNVNKSRIYTIELLVNLKYDSIYTIIVSVVIPDVTLMESPIFLRMEYFGGLYS